MRFFEKKPQKSLPVPKKALPLHPQSREMPFRKGGILVQAESRKACFYAEAQPRMPIGFRRNTSGNSSVGRAQPCQGWGRGSESRFPLNMLNKKEQVAELVDAHVSGACAARRAGSSPVLGTLFYSRVKLTCWRGGGIGRRATLRG